MSIHSLSIALCQSVPSLIRSDSLPCNVQASGSGQQVQILLRVNHFLRTTVDLGVVSIVLRDGLRFLVPLSVLLTDHSTSPRCSCQRNCQWLCLDFIADFRA